LKFSGADERGFSARDPAGSGRGGLGADFEVERDATPVTNARSVWLADWRRRMDRVVVVTAPA